MTQDSLKNHNLFHVPLARDFRDAAVAIIYLDNGQYLMQLRDDKPGIFYPDHWGTFGGAIDPGEKPEQALYRELKEELNLDVSESVFFTKMDFGFQALGIKQTYRMYFEIVIKASQLQQFTLGEGQAFDSFDIDDLVLTKRVVPYDSFAIWMHHVWVQRGRPDRLD